MAVDRKNRRFTTWKRALFATLATVAMTAGSLGGAALAATAGNDVPERGLPGVSGATQDQLELGGDSDGSTSDAVEGNPAPVNADPAGPVADPTPADATRDALPNLMQLTKSTTQNNLKPGDTFSYKISVPCNQTDCLDAQITDVLPPALTGMKVTLVSTNTSGGKAPKPDFEWTPALGEDGTIPAGAKLVVTPKLENGANGIPNGQLSSVTITIKVPDDWPYTWEYNGEAFTNEAEVTASNSKSAQGKTDVTVTVPLVVNVAPTKTWEPATSMIVPDTPSTVTLGVSNTSNAPVDSLTIQEPKAAENGADKLDTNNPFTINDFVGFGNATAPLPEGAASVETWVYVKTGATYQWQVAASGPSPSLGSTDPGNVAGIRLVYTGTEIAIDANATVELDLKQREKDRDTDQKPTKTTVINNTASATVTKDDEPEVQKDATAKGTFNPVDISATITKTISPGRIQAGSSAISTLTGKNHGTGANSLTISDQSFFIKDTITFGGFVDSSGNPAKPSAPSVAPGGTVLEGKIVYTSFDGTEQTIDITADDLTPDFGYADVAGFDVIWTAPDGALITNTTASTVRFKIDSTEAATALNNPRPAETNTAQAKVTTPYGPSELAENTADLNIFKPEMDVSIEKDIRPDKPVHPEDRVLVQLTASYETSGAGITPTELVVEDSWGEDKDVTFWNAFDLYSVAPTGVPGNTSLTIQVQLPDGTWHEVLAKAATAGSTTVTLTNEQLLAGLPDGIFTSDLTGVKFTFTKPNGISGTRIPNVMFQARDKLRDGTGPTYDPDADPKIDDDAIEYTNVAGVEGTATNDKGEPVTGSATIESELSGVLPPREKEPNEENPGDDPVGPEAHIEKEWMLAATGTALAEELGALSGNNSWTALQWRLDEPTTDQVPSKYVTLQDDGALGEDGEPITGISAKTVYNAFNLVGIEGVPSSTVAGSNGWALRWDKVTDIQIYYDGDWHQPQNAVSRLASGNYVDVTTNTDGVPTAAAFPQLDLTEDEQAKATALKIKVEPNAETRAMANGANGAPGINDGVLATTDFREFRLKWQLRDTLRTNPATFVTPNQVYNYGSQEGKVNNTVQISGRIKKDETAESQIGVVKSPVSVEVKKTASTEKVQKPGDPVTFTLTAESLGAAAPSYLRISDPMPSCTDSEVCSFPNTEEAITANPYAVAPTGGWLKDSPFNRLKITSVEATSHWTGVDLSNSTAWVLRYNEETKAYTSNEMSVSELNSLGDYSDVIAVTANFNAASTAVGVEKLIPEDAEFKLVIGAELRDTVRSTGESTYLQPNQVEKIKNTSLAQVWDPILNMNTEANPGGGEGVGPSASAQDAMTSQVGMVITAAPEKTISGDKVVGGKILEVDRAEPITVKLKANPADSQLAPRQVWVSDDANTSPEFWDAFELKGFAGVLTAPEGADQVQFDVLVGGEWVEGQPTLITQPRFPEGVELADIMGVRAVFSRADGKLFGQTDDPESVGDAEWGELEIPLTFGVRDSYVFPESGDDTITNVMETQSVRDVDDPESVENSLVADAEADITLSSGFFALSVNKSVKAAREVEVGTDSAWELSFTNTGTGLVTITELIDYLGNSDAAGNHEDDSSYLAVAAAGNPSYSTSPGGTLSTEGVTYEYDPDTDLIKWTWPEGGQRMQPGEKFTISINLELQPGLKSGQKAFNSMEVHTKQVLTGGAIGAQTVPAFTNSDPAMQTNPDNGSWAVAGDSGTQGAGTKDYIEPLAIESLFAQKAVYGYHPAGAGSATHADECQATVVGQDGAHYVPSPCISNTRYSTAEGVVDKWLLRVNNTTTVDVNELVFFDELPVEGDGLVIGGASRGSTYRPVMTGDIEVQVPDDVTIESQTIEITEDKGACEGAWDQMLATPGETPCESGDATWTNIEDGQIDWAKVAGIRVRLTFEDHAPLANGDSADVVYSTYNLIESDPATNLKSSVPAVGQQAWNQFGTQWNQAGVWGQRAPAAVGVSPATGSLQIEKALEGEAQHYAPATIDFSVACSIRQFGLDDPIDLEMSDDANVTLTKGDDGQYDTARVDGIPLGATCTVTELGDTGATSSEGTPTTLDIVAPNLTETQGDEPGTEEGEGGETGGETGTGNLVPEAQIAKVTNKYDFASLSVTKKVDSKASGVDFGVFEFNLACTTKDDQTVKFPGEGEDGEPTELESVDFTLEDGDIWESPDNAIPDGSTCVLKETDNGGADGVTITVGDNVTENSDNSASILVTGNTRVASIVTNTFDSGTLKVEKKVVAPTGRLLPFADQTFRFGAQCVFTNQAGTEQDMLKAVFDLKAGESETFGPYPKGTVCTVEETTTGGANETTWLNDGEETTVGDAGNIEVTIPGAADGTAQKVVTATNHFRVGAIPVELERVGAGKDYYGVGPFEMTASCVYDIDEVETDLDLPNYGKLSLTAENGYKSALEDVPVGAECSFVESADGGANDWSFVTDTEPRGRAIADDGKQQTVTVTGDVETQEGVFAVNEFHAGIFALTKEVDGKGAKAHGNGTFRFEYDCTLPEGTLRASTAPATSGLFSLKAGETWEGDLYPTGTACTVNETDMGGATSNDIPGEGAQTVIPDVKEAGDIERPTRVDFTVTNHFAATDTGDLPKTGAARVGVISALGIGLLLVGAGALWLVRRRKVNM